MGNREDLLAGAKRCLLEKGYVRTTARDIAQAAGVSLAAIGYHFGTKEVLLDEALTQALREWGDAIVAAPSSHDGQAGRFEATWDRMVASLAAESSLWAVQFELLASLLRDAELRGRFAEANRAARVGLAEVFGWPDPDRNEQVGTLLQMLLAGGAAIAATEPQAVPTGRELGDSIRKLAGELND